MENDILEKELDDLIALLDNRNSKLDGHFDFVERLRYWSMSRPLNEITNKDKMKLHSLWKTTQLNIGSFLKGSKYEAHE